MEESGGRKTIREEKKGGDQGGKKRNLGVIR